ncbi:MAG TPA: NTPase [Nitrospiria bacterium]
MPQKILITGIPGIGKTTVIQKVAKCLQNMNPVGFYTGEIREKKSRVGFKAVSLGGGTQTLSHVQFGGSFRVGRYGVDVKGFEEFLENLDLLKSQSDLVIIDEIGKMECLSAKFNALIVSLFESQKNILATIAKKGGGMIQRIKNHPNCLIFEVQIKNRDKVVEDIVNRVS